jgi:hypothetical protein
MNIDMLSSSNRGSAHNPGHCGEMSLGQAGNARSFWSAAAVQLIKLRPVWHNTCSVLPHACHIAAIAGIAAIQGSRPCVFGVPASSGCATRCASHDYRTAGSTFNIAAASTMKESTGTNVGQREQQDAGPLPDSTHASDNAFETENSRFFVADESVRRTATW